jgi:hypothetical protein
MAFLRLGAEAHDERAHLRDALVRGAGDAVALQLLDVDHHLAGVERHAAPLARPVGRDPAPRVELAPPVLHVEPAGAVQKEAQLRRVLGLEPGADFAAEVLVGERVVVLRRGRHAAAPVVSRA